MSTVLLQQLKVRDFRNFAEATLEFGPDFTVLHGHNGAGKTNLLEAIYLVSTLRSFRTSDLGPLVRHEAGFANIAVQVADPVAGIPSALEVRLERRGQSTRRTASADGKVIRSAAQFYGRVRAVLFTPEDLAVLRGGPSGRRQFVDRMLFARDRAHITAISKYDKLVRSRNSVMRRDDLPASERENLLDTYESGLAAVGANIWSARTALLEELSSPFGRLFSQIHGEVGPRPEADDPSRFAVAGLSYVSKLGSVASDEREAVLREQLRSCRATDERRGMTTIGPHRDDIAVALDGQSAGQFASQGQTRALVLALKLAELQAARSATGQPPLLLLDDVSSELDPNRSALLFSTLARDAGQCVLTTTASKFVELPTSVAPRRWLVESATVKPESKTVN